VQSCWKVTPERGFLMNPDPLVSVRQALDGIVPTAVVDAIEGAAHDMPALMVSSRVRPVLDSLPMLDVSKLTAALMHIDFRAIERLMQMYSYFGNAYVHGDGALSSRIPATIAVPLVGLSALVERPPILSYSGYVLANWRRTSMHTPVTADDLRLIQQFLGVRDESWFVLIHVEIEHKAASAVGNLQDAVEAADAGDAHGLETALTGIHEAVERMIAVFRRMPQACDPNVYWAKVRPYIFSYDQIVYEGVEAFAGQPQSFRGQTGAQSSVVPALVAGLGLNHEQTGLTEHLNVMKAYMPRPHREFINRMGLSVVRQFVQASGRPALIEAYNACLRRVAEFRTLHYHFATEYIFKKVSNPVGTGGTIFMDWLKQLIIETEAQFV
jgi:indoleamine 2,3-dioxygenase